MTGSRDDGLPAVDGLRSGSLGVAIAGTLVAKYFRSVIDWRRSCSFPELLFSWFLQSY